MANECDSSGNESLPPHRLRKIPADLRNTAPQTRARYEYQDECIAILILEHLSNALEGVLIEHSTDVILLPRDTPPEIISIKHREPHHSVTPSWDWPSLKKDKVFDDLHRAWKEAGEDCSVSFYSNAGFSGSAQKIWRACVKQDAAAKKQVHSDFQRKLNLPPVEAERFLDALALPENPLPRRNEISDVAIRMTAEYLTSHGRNKVHAEACYTHLLARIREASTETPPARRTTEKRTFSTVRAGSLSHSNEGIRSRWLSREMLHGLLLFEADRMESLKLPDTGHPGWEIDPLFTGRHNHLRRVQELLKVGDPDPVPPLVIHGISGIGKTALAIQFAALHQNELVVKFLDGSSRANLTDGLYKLSGGVTNFIDLDVPSASSSARMKLPFSAATLLLIDGVTNPEDVRGLIPRNSTCRVLITSTAGHIDEGFNHICLAAWSEEEAVSFCGKAFGDEINTSFQNLVTALGSHPLAINQAVNYCKSTGISITDYTHRLQSYPQEILDSGRAAGHPLTLTKTVTMAIEAISSNCPLALDLLNILSYMGASPVPTRLFDAEPVRPFATADRRGARKAWFKARRGISSKSDWGGFTSSAKGWEARQELHNPIKRDEATSALQQFGLASLSRQHLSLHPLTQAVVRTRLASGLPWIETALGLVSGLMPVQNSSNSTRLHSYTGTVATVVRHAIDADLTGPAVILVNVVLCEELCKLGAHKDALPLAQEVYQITCSHYDKGLAQPYHAFYVRKALSTTLLLNGHIEDAVAIAQENISMAVTECKDMASRLIAYAEFARMVVKGRLTEKAEDALWHLPDPSIFESATQPGNIDLALRIAHMRTRLLILLNREEEALSSNSWAREHLPKLTNPEAKYYLHLALNSDAAILASHFRDHETGLRHQGILAREMREYDSERRDPEYIETLINLADGHLDNTDAESAGTVLRQVEQLLDLKEMEWSPLRAAYASIKGRYLLFEALPGSQRVAEGIRLLSDAIEWYKGAPAPLRGPLPAALINVAGGYSLLGQLDEALTAAHEALDIDKKIYPSGHPEILMDEMVIHNLPIQAQLSLFLIRGGHMPESFDRSGSDPAEDET